MKYRTLIWPTVLGAVTVSSLLLASCAREDFDWLIGTPINVVATTEPATRSGDNIQTANFDNGAEINAYYNAGEQILGKNPTILTASAAEAGKNRLTPDVQPYYPQTDNVDIMALYPRTTATKGITSFTVKPDQQDESNYKLSDLMWAGKTNQAKTTSDVDLTFSHMMAKMSVTVTGKEGVLIKSVKIVNVQRSISISALSASACTLGAIGTETGTEILLASTSNTTVNNQLSGSVLFPPQTITGHFIQVETSLNNKTGYAYYSVSGKTFESGKAYSANLVVKQQDIGFTTTITDWSANNGSIAVPPGSSAGLKIAAIPSIEYNGQEQKPALYITYTPNSNDTTSIKAGTYILKASEVGKKWDYEAEYFNNVNQGTAMVIITGKLRDEWSSENHDSLALGNLISQLKAMTSFEITAARGNLAYPSHSKEVEYNYNTTVDYQLDTHKGDGMFTYESSNATVADVTVSGVVTIRSAGTTRITASMDNSGNYSAASDYYDLTVNKRKIKSHYNAAGTGDITVTLSAESFPYTGEECKPAVVVKDNGRTLQEGTHYELAYSDNTNVGKATIVIRGKGNYSDLDADTIHKNFTITAITPNITLDQTAAKLAKGQKLTRRAKTDYGTITYSASPAGYVTIDNNGVVTATNCGTDHASQVVTVTASVAANASGWSTASKSYQLTVTESDWSYGYTGGVQTWTCPIDGVYELEAMGAKGADDQGFNGGKGADVAGQVFIKEGQKLYIYVGQGGSTSAAFNGGGSSTSTGGGGATDFALKSATWSTEDHLYSRILVAGGGGGALYWSTSTGPHVGAGGSGGGEGDEDRADYQGETGIGGSHPGGGGKINGAGQRTSGATNGADGAFGVGGNYTGTDPAGAGGGGWYGGASGATGSENNRQGSGGGGSSFIYNSANITAAGVIKDSKKYDELLKVPSESEGNYFTAASLNIVPTTLVTGGSPDANGQARITYKSAE